MSTSGGAATIGGISLLERAITYTLGSLLLVTPEALPWPTPCTEWDLAALLAHMEDSLLALSDAVGVGRIALAAPAGPPMDVDIAGRLRDRAGQLLGTWVNGAERRQLILVGGCPVTAGIVAGAGALEVAVHGWDVARACGRDRPLPTPLAEELLDLSPLLVTAADRGQFAEPLWVGPRAGPHERLLAHLGRAA